MGLTRSPQTISSLTLWALSTGLTFSTVWIEMNSFLSVSTWMNSALLEWVSSPIFGVACFCLLSHGVSGFVLLMTPSRSDLIHFAIGNWWHTDSPRCLGTGWHAQRGRSYCKQSPLTNKALLLMINGKWRCVCVCTEKNEPCIYWVEVLLSHRLTSTSAWRTMSFVSNCMLLPV